MLEAFKQLHLILTELTEPASYVAQGYPLRQSIRRVNPSESRKMRNTDITPKNKQEERSINGTG